jgi:hypothetical protein
MSFRINLSHRDKFDNIENKKVLDQMKTILYFYLRTFFEKRIS